MSVREMSLRELNDSLISSESWIALMEETLDLVHKETQRMRVDYWTEALLCDTSREQALSVLAKDNGIHNELGPVLCGSSVFMQALLVELVAAYFLLRFPSALDRTCKRTSDALVLLKCIATHPDTRTKLLDDQIAVYMMPFLQISDPRRPYELLRFGCLSVISALLQDDDEVIVDRLLKTRLFPQVLRSLEQGHEFTKTVAAFIVFRILLHDSGLNYCCVLPDRFYAICRTLASVVSGFGPEPDPMLLSCVTGCYVRLSKHPRACDGLLVWLPGRLRDFGWTNRFNDDTEVLERARLVRVNVAYGHYGRPISLWDGTMNP